MSLDSIDRDDEGTTSNWRENLPAWAEDATQRARTFEPDTLTNSQVVGLATGIAVALGTVLAAFGPAAPEPPRRPAGRVTAGTTGKPVVAVVEGKKVSARTQRELRRQVEALQGEIGKVEKLAKQQRAERDPILAENVLVPVKQQEVDMTDDAVVAVLKNGKLTRRSRKELRKQVNGLQKDIDRLNKAVQKEDRRIQRRAAVAEAREALSGAVSGAGDTAGKRLAAAGAATTAAVSPLLDRARDSDLPDQVRSNARQIAGTTRDSARQFAEATRDRTSDLTDRVRGDFLPQVAEQLGRVRDEVVPQVADFLQQARDEIAPQVADVAAKAGATVSALAASGAAASRETAKTIAKGDLAKTVDKQTRRGRKQAASALNSLAAQLEPPQQKRNLNGLWAFAIIAAIGGALYYYVFQNEERRKKVIETTKSVVEQGREIVRDFQGYDEEF